MHSQRFNGDCEIRKHKCKQGVHITVTAFFLLPNRTLSHRHVCMARESLPEVYLTNHFCVFLTQPHEAMSLFDFKHSSESALAECQAELCSTHAQLDVESLLRELEDAIHITRKK